MARCIFRRGPLPRDLAAERRRPAALGLDLGVRVLVHLDRLRMVVALVALDLLAHDGDVLVDLRRDTIDSGGLGERHTRPVRCKVGRAAWRAPEPAAGDLDGMLVGTRDTGDTKRTITGTEHFCRQC